MKLIYRGGYDKSDKESVKKSLFYEYGSVASAYLESGKKVTVVTFAKPDHYYDEILLQSFSTAPDVIDFSTPNNIKWQMYDLIFLPGGSTQDLKNKLLEYGFNIAGLKDSAVVIGDSSGAYILSKYYVEYSPDITKETLMNYVKEGLNPESNLLTIAHCNDKARVTPEKLEVARQLAKKLGVRLLLLNENESKLSKNGDFVDFDINEVLSF